MECPVDEPLAITPHQPAAAAAAVPQRMLVCGTGASWRLESRGVAPLQGAVDDGSADAEEVGELSGAVLAGLEQLHQMCFLTRVELGLLAAKPALGLATFMPSRVRSRIRSDSIMWTPVSCQGSSGAHRPT